MKRIIFLLTFGLLAASTGAQDQNRTIIIGQKFSLTSDIVKEDRSYWVYLPESYTSTVYARQSYPVLYLLDGDAYFHSASGVVQFMSAGINANVQTPELIVVAVLNTNRTRDLTPTRSTMGYDGKDDPSLASSGGADAFLKFMRDELIPHIETSYRTVPYRILVGHSLGGLLALHAFLDSPDLFQAYIAIDPSLFWDNQVLLSRARNRPAQTEGQQRVVYMSLANTPAIGGVDPKLMPEAARAFARVLESRMSPRLRSTLQYFEAEDHGSVPLLSLYHGLLYTFEGYKPSIDEVVERPTSVTTHFARISERLGVDLPPPERFVDLVGYFVLYTIRDADKAVELFRLNVSNYPGSSNVYDSLAEAYIVKGEKQLAIQNYEESLRLNPNNQNAKDRLEKLRAQ